MNMDDALQTFVIESRELLQQMEESLLEVEHAPHDIESINAIFRAAHTIKGSAGLFGLDPIVAFTHVAESVLDKVRDNELQLTETLVALFLQVCDQLGILIERVAAGEDITAEVQQQNDKLAGALNRYLQQGATDAQQNTASPLPVEHQQPYTLEDGGEVATDNWHISLRFGQDVLRNGMDPFAFIRYLGTLGRLVNLVTLTDALPSLEAMDPECSYLGFEIAFDSDASKAEIEGVFEFVREDSHIRILPPRSKISEYLDLIDNLPEEDLRLGEILVRCGTLTNSELTQALQLQQQSSEVAGTPLGKVLQSQSMVEAPLVEAALEKQQQIKENKSAMRGSIRVDAEKLDHLINLVGELIVAAAGANLRAQLNGDAVLLENNATVSQLVEQVRDSTLTLRMVQIGATFNRFNRVVRDVSRELGKDIGLQIQGADTELDKTVVEQIGDPLTHLVRNAMDHGIEPAAVRTARGKPARGTIRLNAYHDSGSIIIEVADDGGGLSRDKIFAKAVERGLIAADAALTDQEVYNLIFEPGFSTADQVSKLSGRGVGMDVVRRNIQALRGDVLLHSDEGIGSTVKIRLPLTLAIIDGFLVRAGDYSYVIPLDRVDECVELSAWQNRGGDGHYLNLRGEVLPYLKIRELFGIEGTPPKRENVVVVRADGKKVGLVVDRLLGEFQTVIKPLGRLFSHLDGLGGFTILGSGKVALILDVAKLIDHSVHSEREVYEQRTNLSKQALHGLTHAGGKSG